MVVELRPPEQDTPIPAMKRGFDYLVLGKLVAACHNQILSSAGLCMKQTEAWQLARNEISWAAQCSKRHCSDLGKSLQEAIENNSGSIIPYCIDQLSIEDDGRTIKLCVLGHPIECKGYLVKEKCDNDDSFSSEYCIRSALLPDREIISYARISTSNGIGDWFSDMQMYCIQPDKPAFAESFLIFLIVSVYNSKLVQKS
ncbi:hypothetical protein LH425_06550 [Laribacter hongkongensis]|uniref:hypothetical protein n=1 Tax=Laribacter hongkongensis TaxID=168471 RepID=UPI001EFDB3C3|nr:hypothetical protein [Laribacter hongkongensis]MCG9064703.1 hypothetical protein [Laribacter hongkongensis]